MEGVSFLERGIIEGENPVYDPIDILNVSSFSRVGLFGIAALNRW